MSIILPSFAGIVGPVSSGGGGGGGAVTNEYALSLDGTDDYARLTGMTLSGAFTASFWFNPLSHAMGSGDLFMTKGYDANPHTSETDWKLDYASGGFRYSVFDRTQSWATKLEATHTFSFSANTWYHIMITYDGGTSTSGMALFVDGVSKTLTTATQNPSFTGNNSTSATAVNVGNASQWSGGKLTGLIDEVAFWETDQSANISSIYTGTAPIDLSGLSTAPNDWFRFENNANNEISGGSGSASLVNGPTFVQGVPSVPAAYSNTYSLDFSATDDYLDTGSNFGSTFQSDYTISTWFKRNETSATAWLFGHDYRVGGKHILKAYYTSSAIVFNFQIASASATASFSYTADTNWHHLVVSASQSGGSVVIKIYLDGVYKNTGSVTASLSNYVNPVAFTFAGGNDGSSVFSHSNAKQDEIAIFGSALSDGSVSTGQTAGGDIATLYGSGSPSNISSLSPVAWYRMGDNDGGTGTTITDQGSGGNDGTLVNGPTFATDTP